MTVTFFGHRLLACDLQTPCRNLLIDLIESCNATRFYVGNQGEFDALIHTLLKELKKDYPQISCFVVLAYLPQSQDPLTRLDTTDTIYPEGLERVPYRFAISKRNEWMIDHSDFVVTYVTHSFGGAAQFQRIAKRKGKQIRNLFDLLPPSS